MELYIQLLGIITYLFIFLFYANMIIYYLCIIM